VDDNMVINISLDPDFLLNCFVCITSNTQCVKMNVGLYEDLNLLLNNIQFSQQSHILLKALKLMSIDKCNGDNILSIKCLQQDQKVQLTRENVTTILELSDSVEEVIQMKEMYTRSLVLQHVCEIAMFLGKEMLLTKDTNITHCAFDQQHISGMVILKSQM